MFSKSHRFAFSLGAFFFVVGSAWAQTLDVDQLRFYDQDLGGDPGTLTSRYEFRYTYTPSSQPQYLNLFVDNGGGSPLWAGNNIPLPGISAVGSSPFTMTFHLDLGSQFSGPTSNLNLSANSSVTPLAAPGGFSFAPKLVNQGLRFLNGGVKSGDKSLYQMFTNPALNIGALNFNSAVRTSMPNVVQQLNYCGPGAAANSLVWIAGQKSLNLGGDTTTSIMNTLAPIMGNANDGNWDDDQIRGKLNYIKTKNLPLSITYTGGRNLIPTGSFSNADGSAKGLGPVTWNWILGEFNKGSDLMFMTDKHWVVGAGFVDVGGRKYVITRDDPFQKGAATTPQQAAIIAQRWSLAPYDEINNTIDIGGWGARPLRTVVSTSFVPEPATFVALGVGLLALRRRKKA